MKIFYVRNNNFFRSGYILSYYFCIFNLILLGTEVVFGVFVTIHGLEAAHSNNSGRYSELCRAKIAPLPASYSHGMRSGSSDR